MSFDVEADAYHRFMGRYSTLLAPTFADFAGVEHDGHEAVARQGDASAEGHIAALIAVAVKEFGPVDIYVANAGITGPPGLVIPEDEWDRVLAINLRAHIRAATQLVPIWADRGGGYFIAVASG